MMLETANKCGVDNPTKFVQELMDDIDSIIMKLKFFYNDSKIIIDYLDQSLIYGVLKIIYCEL